jgi:hypothetical protein
LIIFYDFRGFIAFECRMGAKGGIFHIPRVSHLHAPPNHQLWPEAISGGIDKLFSLGIHPMPLFSM